MSDRTGSSYNDVMTSITEPLVHRPLSRSARNPILGFIAGLAVAGAFALGINVTSGGASPGPAPASPTVSAPAQSLTDGGCVVFHGRC